MIIDWTVCNYQESFTFLQTVFKWDGEAKASFFIWIMKKYLNLLHRKGKFYVNNKWNIMYHPLSRVGTQTVEYSAFVGYDNAYHLHNMFSRKTRMDKGANLCEDLQWHHANLFFFYKM